MGTELLIFIVMRTQLLVVCIALLLALASAKLRQTNKCNLDDDKCFRKFTNENIEEIIELSEDNGKDARKAINKIIREPESLCKSSKSDCESYASCMLADAVLDEYNDYLEKTNDCQGNKFDDLEEAVREERNEEAGVRSAAFKAAEDARDECKLIADFNADQRRQCRQLVHCVFLEKALVERYDDYFEINEDRCPDVRDDQYIEFCDFACREEYYRQRLSTTLEDIVDRVRDTADDQQAEMEDKRDEIDDLCVGTNCDDAQACVVTRRLLKKYDDYIEDTNCGKSERRDAKEEEDELAYRLARDYRREMAAK